MMISSFNRDKKISSTNIALISLVAGPNLIIIDPFNFQFLIIDCSEFIFFITLKYLSIYSLNANIMQNQFFINKPLYNNN